MFVIKICFLKKIKKSLFKDKSFITIKLGDKQAFRTESEVLQNTTNYTYKTSFIYEVAHSRDMNHQEITLRLAVKPPREQRKTPLYNDEKTFLGKINCLIIDFVNAIESFFFHFIFVKKTQKIFCSFLEI